MNRAVVLLGAVITFVIVLMVITLMTLMEETNRSAAADQMKRLEMAMKAELDIAQRELAIVASGQSGRFAGSISSQSEASLAARFENAWHFFGFDSIYALDGEGDVIIGMEAGAIAGKAGYSLLAPVANGLIRSVKARQQQRLAGSGYRLSSPGYEQMFGVSMLIHDGTGLALASVVPVNPDNQTSAAADIMVAIRALPDRRLSDIGQRHSLTDLRFRGARYALTPFALPVRGMDGELIGHIAWTFSDPGSRLLTNLLAIVLAGVLAIIAAFAVLFQRLRKLGGELALEEETTHRLATRDHLSGLLNRLGFNERAHAELQRSSRTGGGFALHIIDLDRFKEVNDTLGHEAGDTVIREVARRISERVRGADIVARLGGDEFAVIQVETETTHEAGALASRLREALRLPIKVGKAEVTIGCSIGLVLAPVEDHDITGLLRLADSALYEAKNDGRNRHRFFENSINEGLKLKQLVEEELRDAIINNQLELHYQPQVSADGLRIVGVEALVRWRHPVRGLIPPLEFISVAEERGLIVPLSEWVLRRACEDGKRWGNLKVAVNVSATQFKQTNFVADLMRSVHAVGFDPQRLELELTEGMIVEDEDNAERAISALRDYGISLALDDFGTGYSSLIYLRRFSFDKIKIDRSFLEAMETTGESAILVHSVVHLGRALGLTVCAEGIETKEQHRFLQAVGCHELQGYLFSRPVPASEIDKLLALEAPFSSAA